MLSIDILFTLTDSADVFIPIQYNAMQYNGMQCDSMRCDAMQCISHFHFDKSLQCFIIFSKEKEGNYIVVKNAKI